MVIAGGWHEAAKHCDTCKSAAAVVFCRDDVVFLCFNCDSRIHRNDTEFPVRHERVWLCAVCEQAPASVTCRADAAALCVSCDADIHAANNLASRHDRVPVEPFFEAAESMVRSKDELEEGAWLLPNLNHGDFKTVVDNHVLSLNEMEFLLDLEFENGGMNRFHSSAMDSLTPVHTNPVPALVNPVISRDRTREDYSDIDFCRSKLSPFGHFPPSTVKTLVPLAPSISDNRHDHIRPSYSQVSWSSLDVGVVSEDALSNNSSNPSVTNTATSVASQPTQLCRADREARVLRYREKRKKRKFEKTIRYASRKAYAETRPRIKGRFSKRSETETDSDIDNYFFFPVDAHYVL